MLIATNLQQPQDEIRSDSMCSYCEKTCESMKAGMIGCRDFKGRKLLAHAAIR